jgi:hypothetical protein
MTNRKKISIDGIEVGGAMTSIRAVGFTKAKRPGPPGHRPALGEAVALLDHLEANGDSDDAFDRKYLKEAQLWKTHGCAQMAAE